MEMNHLILPLAGGRNTLVGVERDTGRRPTHWFGDFFRAPFGGSG